jgi:lysophospholipase L1-like esterase
MLSARYSSQAIAVANEGLPLEEAADGVRRLPGLLREVSPEVVILLEGVNDLTGPTVVSRTLGFLNTMARDARFAGANVFLCTLLPQRPGGFRANDPQAVASYNAGVRDLARGEGATLVDLSRDVDLSLIGIDGLHPTEAGYDRMAQIFFDLIRAQFERAPTTALLVPPGGM